MVPPVKPECLSAWQPHLTLDCRSVVSLGKIRLLTDFSSSGVSNADDKEGEYHQYVALDGAALQNLEVLHSTTAMSLGFVCIRVLYYP